MPDDEEIAGLLQLGLRRVPVPTPGSDFDARVRAGLRRPAPSRRPFWDLVGAALVPAACSLVLTLTLLKGVGTPAKGAPGAPAPPAGNVVLDPRPDRIRSVEQGLERLDSDTPSIGGFANPTRVVPWRSRPRRSGAGRG